MGFFVLRRVLDIWMASSAHTPADHSPLLHIAPVPFNSFLEVFTMTLPRMPCDQRRLHFRRFYHGCCQFGGFGLL